MSALSRFLRVPAPEDHVEVYDIAEQKWLADVAEHGRLSDDINALKQAQTILMENVRYAGTQDPISTDSLEDVSEWKQRLKEIDTDLVVLNHKQQQIETLALTYEPKRNDDATRVLEFISRVLGRGRRIEPTYLASVLELCAEKLTGQSAMQAG